MHDHMTYDFEGPHAQIGHNVPADFGDYLSMHLEIRDEITHHELQTDLAGHLWVRHDMAARKGNTFEL